MVIHTRKGDSVKKRTRLHAENSKRISNNTLQLFESSQSVIDRAQLVVFFHTASLTLHIFNWLFIVIGEN